MSEVTQLQSEVVQMQVEDGVALITLNRADRLNAWTAEMEHAYFALLEQCARAPEVRVIVVTGAGRGFCAGADMQELQAIGDGRRCERRHARAPAAERCRCRSPSRSSPRSTALAPASASYRR